MRRYRDRPPRHKDGAAEEGQHLGPGGNNQQAAVHAAGGDE